VERAVRALIAIALLTLGIPAGLASAQTASVSLQLVRQSPWSSSYGDPRLLIWVSATNTGTTPFRDLSVALTIGEHYDSRVSYESSLDEGPTTSIFETPHEPVRGSLDPFEPRTFKLKLDLSQTPGIDPVENLVYPARVDIRSGNTVIASLTTPILYFVQEPLAPMQFSWWVELEPTIAFGPDGRLEDTAFPGSLDTTGQLGAPITALDQALLAHPREAIRTSLVLTPSLVQQAQEAAAGYSLVNGTSVDAGTDGAATATTFLASLKRVMAARGIESVPTPFSGPTIPSMLASDLRTDLNDQRQLGMQILQSLSGIPAQTGVVRPIDGALSEDALDWLSGTGATTILGDTDTVDRVGEEAVEGEPAPTATLATSSGGTLDLVLPDPGAEGLLERPDLLADPVRAAQAVLGELAVEWKEAPVPPEPDVRGRALALPSSLPPGLWAPLLERFRRTPFLRSVDPATFAAAVVPHGAPATLRSPDTSAFPFTYTEGPAGIRGLHGQIDDYRSMLVEPSPVPDELTRDIYYAESAPYLDDPSGGEVWLGHVHDTTRAVLESVQPRIGQGGSGQGGFTFTSGEGTIPIVMGDPGDVPLRVTVRLDSSQFEYPDGNQQDVTLDRPNKVVTFRVVAKAAGQNPIVVRVLAPNGNAIGEPQTIVVRSTAFNRIALIVTLAAAAVLALLYSRRWFRRTKVPS
jgi:hypothetical protein